MIIIAAYITALGFSLFGGVLGSKGFKNQKIAVFLSFFPLFFIAMLREGIGTDYINYVNLIEGLRINEPSLYGWKKPEPLFVFLCELIIKLEVDYQWLFVITSFVYCFLICYVIYNVSPIPSLSIFLLFGTTCYFASLNEVRQHVACAILFLALKFALEKNLKAFIIAVAIASSLHVSCILFVFVYFLDFLKISPKKAILIIVLYSISMKTIVSIIYYFLKDTAYSVHLLQDVRDDIWIGIVIQLIIFLFASLLYQNETEYRFLYSVQIVCFCLTVLQSYIPLMYRAKWMFYYPIVLLIPMSIRRIKDIRLRLIVIVMLVICFTIYSYITIVVNKGHGVYPYNWVF